MAFNMDFPDLPADAFNGFTVNPLRLPEGASLGTDHVESIEWYGPGKLHPTHVGDLLHNERFRVVAKLDHQGQSLSWLCRDTVQNKWRRIDIFHASDEITTFALRSANYAIHERQTSLAKPEQQARLEKAHHDAVGRPLETFFHAGANGRHLCVVVPLNGMWNCFRWSLASGGRDSVPMDESWFLRECAAYRARRVPAWDPPRDVHAITEEEMVRILAGVNRGNWMARPVVVVLGDEMRRRASGRERGQLPMYLVLRPERIMDADEEDEDEDDDNEEEEEEEDEGSEYEDSDEDEEMEDHK
ncbi:hypothetical protein VTK26DRAFT_6900 [Humicola hyalothermophila]